VSWHKDVSFGSGVPWDHDPGYFETPNSFSEEEEEEEEEKSFLV